MNNNNILIGILAIFIGIVYLVIVLDTGHFPMLLISIIAIGGGALEIWLGLSTTKIETKDPDTDN